MIRAHVSIDNRQVNRWQEWRHWRWQCTSISAELQESISEQLISQTSMWIKYFMWEILLTSAISVFQQQKANRPRVEKHHQMVEIRLTNTDVNSATRPVNVYLALVIHWQIMTQDTISWTPSICPEKKPNTNRNQYFNIFIRSVIPCNT